MTTQVCTYVRVCVCVCVCVRVQVIDMAPVVSTAKQHFTQPPYVTDAALLDRVGTHIHTHTRARARAPHTHTIAIYKLHHSGVQACAYVCVCVCVCHPRYNGSLVTSSVPPPSSPLQTLCVYHASYTTGTHTRVHEYSTQHTRYCSQVGRGM